MKKRLHNKAAGIAILFTLIVISVMEVIFRALVMGKEVLTTANLGEPLVVIAFAVAILILTAMGKDRVCYLCYGAWAGYFILDQLFELPGVVVEIVRLMTLSNRGFSIDNLAIIVRALSMCGIIAIGVMLVEYMDDGTVNNRAFNCLSIVTVVLILYNIGASIFAAFTGIPILMLEFFNALYRITMVFLFTFFAYDSAKYQLKKTDLTKE